MGAHQADDVLSYRRIGEIAAAHPPAVEDQTGHSVGVRGRPRGGDDRTERGAHQIDSIHAGRFHHGAQRFELQTHRRRAHTGAREPTAGPVVSHERSTAGEHLVVAPLRRHRPAQLEVRQPSSDVHQWRTITDPGEGNIAAIAELNRIDRLLQRPESASGRNLSRPSDRDVLVPRSAGTAKGAAPSQRSE